MSDDEQRTEEAKKFLHDLSQRSTSIRSKEREFHGLQREFAYYQEQIYTDYNKSKDIKHPRDVGQSREEILRKFFLNNGCLPKRYSVSLNSARVASSTGHISKEIDILFYDPIDSICLMNRENVYTVFPIESVYGVIQIKSRLTKKEIDNGLANIASFKKLDKIRQESSDLTLSDARKSERGFGILFAYDSDLEWTEICQEVESFAKKNPNRLWCNAVVILNKGIILHGENNYGVFRNTGLERIENLRIFGSFDWHNQCLYQFYSILISLLRNTCIQPADVDSYFRLPLIADEHSYYFCRGEFDEVGTCMKHGDYLRKIAPDKLEKLVRWCRNAEPINWIKAIDIAYGMPGDCKEAYDRQPGDVRIYNPENLPLPEILLVDTELNGKNIKGLGYYDIQCAGMILYIPLCESACNNDPPFGIIGIQN